MCYFLEIQTLFYKKKFVVLKFFFFLLGPRGPTRPPGGGGVGPAGRTLCTTGLNYIPQATFRTVRHRRGTSACFSQLFGIIPKRLTDLYLMAESSYSDGYGRKKHTAC